MQSSLSQVQTACLSISAPVLKSLLHLSRHKSGSNYCSCYYGFCRPQRKQTTQQATVSVNVLFTVGDRFVASRGNSHLHLAAAVSLKYHITSFELPVISISFCTNKRIVLVGHTEMESVIKESCGRCGLLWPQQMPPLWPSVQMVIMKRREKRVK